MKREIPLYILLSAVLVMLVLVYRELHTLTTVSTAIKQQMDAPQGMRPARAGGGIPVYITDGPATPSH